MKTKEKFAVVCFKFVAQVLGILKFLNGLRSLLASPSESAGLPLSLGLSGALQNIYLLTGQPGLARLSPLGTGCDSGYTSSQPLLCLSLHVFPGATAQISLQSNGPCASNPWQKQAAGRKGALALLYHY